MLESCLRTFSDPLDEIPLLKGMLLSTDVAYQWGGLVDQTNRVDFIRLKSCGFSTPPLCPSDEGSSIGVIRHVEREDRVYGIPLGPYSSGRVD